MAGESDERAFGDIASKLLFENERVRIWEMRLAAGPPRPVHKHDCAPVLIQISGYRLAVGPDPDTPTDCKDYPEAHPPPANDSLL